MVSHTVIQSRAFYKISKAFKRFQICHILINCSSIACSIRYLFLINMEKLKDHHHSGPQRLQYIRPLGVLGHPVCVIQQRIWGCFVFFFGLSSLVAQTVKNPAANAGDLHSIPRLGKFPGEGNVFPLLYSYLENSLDRGAWRVTVHEVTKGWTRLSD